MLRLEDESGRVGYGEIAPVKGFGGESVDAASRYLERLGNRFETSALDQIPSSYPCTQFGLGSALWMLETPQIEFNLRNCGLLPPDKLAFDEIERLQAQGFTDFKLKMGVGPFQEELSLVEHLVQRLPKNGRLRLDANGGLSLAKMEQWMIALKNIEAISFLEQPMLEGAESMMAEMMIKSGVRVALDESITGWNPEMISNWPGCLVLKTALLGAPGKQISDYRKWSQSLVFSSVFETGIGLLNGLRLAGVVASEWAVGYGTLSYFNDGMNLFEESPVLSSSQVNMDDLARLWKRIYVA